MQMAPGRPKPDGTVKLAAYSTSDGWFDDLGRKPLTATSALLFPDSESDNNKVHGLIIRHGS